MRIVFVGAGSLAVMTASMLGKQGHEVVIVESDKQRIDELTAHLDCGFVHGDGSTPAILKETNPKETDFLFCLTGNDQANIITSLVGRSLGFARVVTKIESAEFEHICIELGLKDTIIPARTIGRYLSDMVKGQDLLELSAMIKDEARVFSFVARAEEEGPVGDLKLPEQSRVICLYRDGHFLLAEGDSELKSGDEVVILLHSKHLPEITERWNVRSQPS
jgi:trk system potassium uptake protein TrkA